MRTIDARGLRRLVGGDLELLADLRRTSPDELARVAREAPNLMVRVDTVAAVLEARRTGGAPAEETWRWAKLLLHKTHPYLCRERGPAPAADDISEIVAAWTRDHAPDFDLPYEDGHDHAIAHVLGALYRDRGDGALEADELSSDYDA